MSDEEFYSDPTAPSPLPDESTPPPQSPPATAPIPPTPSIQPVPEPAPIPHPPATPPKVTSAAADDYLPPTTAPPPVPHRRNGTAGRNAATLLGVLIFLGLVGWLIASVANRSGNPDDAAKPEKVNCPTGRAIDCRASDPEPEIRKYEFTHNPMIEGSPFALIRHDLVGCTAGSRGSLLAAAYRSGCTQVARSLYRSKDMALTTMVFNLDTSVKAKQFATAVRKQPDLLRAIEHPVVKFPDLRKRHGTVAVASGHFTMVIIGQYRDFHPVSGSAQYRKGVSDAGQSLIDYIVARSFK